MLQFAVPRELCHPRLHRPRSVGGADVCSETMEEHTVPGLTRETDGRVVDRWVVLFIKIDRNRSQIGRKTVSKTVVKQCKSIEIAPR